MKILQNTFRTILLILYSKSEIEYNFLNYFIILHSYMYIHVIKIMSFKRIHYLPFTSYPSLCCKKKNVHVLMFGSVH